MRCKLKRWTIYIARQHDTGDGCWTFAEADYSCQVESLDSFLPARLEVIRVKWVLQRGQIVIVTELSNLEQKSQRSYWKVVIICESKIWFHGMHLHIQSDMEYLCTWTCSRRGRLIYERIHTGRKAIPGLSDHTCIAWPIWKVPLFRHVYLVSDLYLELVFCIVMHGTMRCRVVPSIHYFPPILPYIFKLYSVHYTWRKKGYSTVQWHIYLRHTYCIYLVSMVTLQFVVRSYRRRAR